MSKKIPTILNPTKGLSKKEIDFAEYYVIENRPPRECVYLSGYNPSTKNSASVMASNLKKKTQIYIDFLRAEKSNNNNDFKTDDILEDLKAIIKFDIKDVIDTDSMGRITLNTNTYLTKGIEQIQQDPISGKIKIKGYNKTEAMKQMLDYLMGVKQQEMEIEKQKLDLLRDKLELEKARLSGELSNDDVDANLMGAISSLSKSIEIQSRMSAEEMKENGIILGEEKDE